MNEGEVERLTQLHTDALVIDTHCDTIWVKFLEDWGVRHPELQADFPKLKKGGIDVAFYAISGNFAEEDRRIEGHPTIFSFAANFTDPGKGVAVTEAFTNPLVLIPMGNLPSGEYLVEVHIERFVFTYDKSVSPSTRR